MSQQRHPRRRPVRGEIVGDRRGSAGLVATVVMSLAGLVVGTAGGYLSDKPAAAAPDYATSLDLRDAPLFGPGITVGPRSERLMRSLSGGAPERFSAPTLSSPKVIIVFDDMGLDRAVFDDIMRLPGPLTLAFLPYGNESRAMAREARAQGHAVLLHLPMEPAGAADPGPLSLKSWMSDAELEAMLDANLAALDGYVGVNNHMGSRLTRDEDAMETVLAALKERGLFFLDSLTTGQSVASKAGAAAGATVFTRDVFIDAEKGEAKARAQLALVERIAAETGFAVAIAHPRPDTLKAIGPWLASAPARGLSLATVEALPGLNSRAPALAAALRD
ncbi:MAG: divergent polysaccharide deacetylase family protein [Parvularculaceae bacterium]